MKYILDSIPNKIDIDYEFISILENKIINNIPLSIDESKYFLDYIVYSTRLKFTDDIDNYSFEYKCDTACSIIGNYLNSLNVKYKINDTNKCITDGICGHTFMIIELNTINGNINYLVDPTYRQFFTKDKCNDSNYILIDNRYVLTPDPGYFIKDEDKNLISNFLKNGYTILDENIARIYGNSFYNTKVLNYDKNYRSIPGSIYLNSFLKGTSNITKTEEELGFLCIKRNDIKKM